MQPIEQRAMRPEIVKKLNDTGIVAVLVIEELEQAVPVARALLAGGVDTIELTLRTPVAIEAIKAIKSEVPEITVGIGTVLTTKQVETIAKLEVDFAVAPGCNPNVIKASIEHGLSFAPGIMTPSDIEIAVEQGCRILKYFPAETSGGMKHLSSIVAPYSYLGLEFIPLGGLNITNVSAYLESSIIAAIGGSWLANRNLIKNENWSAITKNAMEIKSLIDKIRN